MFSKLVTMTVVLTCLFGGLLVLRSQRLHAAHRNATLHRQVNDLRTELWRAEIDAARSIRLPEFQQQINTMTLTFEPAGIGPSEVDRRLAEANAAGRLQP